MYKIKLCKFPEYTQEIENTCQFLWNVGYEESPLNGYVDSIYSAAEKQNVHLNLSLYEESVICLAQLIFGNQLGLNIQCSSLLANFIGISLMASKVALQAYQDLKSENML